MYQINNYLRGFILFIIICYFIYIISLLKRKKVELKYSLLWIFSGLVMLVLVIFPDIFIYSAKFIGIEVASNGLFAVFIFLLIIILISLTVIISSDSAKIKILVQKIAIMEKRIRELEDK